jgi:hypothetical protein
LEEWAQQRESDSGSSGGFSTQQNSTGAEGK